MKLSREDIGKVIDGWIDAWNEHDLDGVTALLHEDVVFESWDGRKVEGRKELSRSWLPWFGDHRGFHFAVEEVFIDTDSQKALFMWELEWPSREASFEGQVERRRGVDVLHFEDGKIIRKLTYSKTEIEIGGGNVRLTAGE